MNLPLTLVTVIQSIMCMKCSLITVIVIIRCYLCRAQSQHNRANGFVCEKWQRYKSNVPHHAGTARVGQHFLVQRCVYAKSIYTHTHTRIHIYKYTHKPIDVLISSRSENHSLCTRALYNCFCFRLLLLFCCSLLAAN